jgi:uncharacterized RDD family membrane protein YckC
MAGPSPADQPSGPTPPSIYAPLDGSQPARPAPPAPTFKFDGSSQPAVYVYAGWGARGSAYIIDLICINVLPLAITVPLGMAFGLTAKQSAELFTFQLDAIKEINTPVVLFVVLGIQVTLQLFSLALCVWLTGGQTPGKKVMGIRVVMADGSKLSLRTALLRETLAKAIVVPIGALFSLGIVAFLNFGWPAWDRQWRAGHDAFAKTRVVLAKPPGAVG